MAKEARAFSYLDRSRNRFAPASFPILLLLGLLLHSWDALAAPPTISGTPPAEAIVGKAYSFRPQASDRDGDRLRFWIWNKPRWASFDSRTGRLYGTPSSRDVGTTSNITIGVSDSRWSWRPVTLPRFSIAVRAAGSAPSPSPSPENGPPVISGTPSGKVVQGQAYNFTPTASDPDGDTLTFSIANKPSWASFNQSTGRLSGTPTAAHIGNYSNIVVSVSDGSRTASLAPFSIAVVANATGSVTLSWQPPTRRTDGSTLTNLAGYRVHWGTSSGSYPNNVKLSNPGLSSYVVENLAPGTYYFVVTAIDSNGLESGYSNVAQKTIQP